MSAAASTRSRPLSEVNEYEREQAERRASKKAARKEFELAKRRDDFIRAAMQHPQGRDWFYWLLGVTGLNANCFASNALNMSFNCGQSNVGMRVQGELIRCSPKLYVQMLEENADGGRTDEAGTNTEE